MSDQDSSFDSSFATSNEKDITYTILKFHRYVKEVSSYPDKCVEWKKRIEESIVGLNTIRTKATTMVGEIKNQELNIPGVPVQFGALAVLSGTVCIASYIAGHTPGVTLLFGGVGAGVGIAIAYTALVWYKNWVAFRMSREKERWDIDKRYYCENVSIIRGRIAECRDYCQGRHDDIFNLKVMRKWGNEAERITRALSVLLNCFETEFKKDHQLETRYETLSREKLGFIAEIASMQKSGIKEDLIIKHILRNLSTDTGEPSDQHSGWQNPQTSSELFSTKVGNRATRQVHVDDSDDESFDKVSKDEAMDLIHGDISTPGNSPYNTKLSEYIEDLNKTITKLGKISKLLERFKDIFSDMIISQL